MKLTEAQARLVRDNLPIVWGHLANRLHLTPRSPVLNRRDFDDLFQEGVLGLILAAMRWRPDCGYPFAAFAVLRVRAAVWQALRGGPAETMPLPEHLAAWPEPNLPELEIGWHSHDEFMDQVRIIASQPNKRGRRRHIGMRQAIADERIGIARPWQTPVRALAARCGTSASRVCELEQEMIREAREKCTAKNTDTTQ